MRKLLAKPASHQKSNNLPTY